LRESQHVLYIKAGSTGCLAGLIIIAGGPESTSRLHDKHFRFMTYVHMYMQSVRINLSDESNIDVRKNEMPLVESTLSFHFRDAIHIGERPSSGISGK